ncbi:hypothetical protein M885DRAFT_525799 [Pelagophyceae sp. CCMP2097]|nr:hypothetical protein M885DRAFT_525799 [Pelagophyceae sp. CCMP2097]
MRLLLLFGAFLASALPPPWPQQFIATVETTAHLVDRSKDYPPWFRRVEVYYDSVNLRARAAVTDGIDAGKVFTRRYDKKQEFMVRGGEYAECQRSYLGDSMPKSALPADAAKVGTAQIDGRPHDHWLAEVPGYERSHAYFDAETGAPRRLVHEAVNASGDYVTIMTYDILDFRFEAPAESLFELESPWASDSCNRHVGGWAYLHLFHHYFSI